MNTQQLNPLRENRFVGITGGVKTPPEKEARYVVAQNQILGQAHSCLLILGAIYLVFQPSTCECLLTKSALGNIGPMIPGNMSLTFLGRTPLRNFGMTTMVRPIGKEMLKILAEWSSSGICSQRPNQMSVSMGQATARNLASFVYPGNLTRPEKQDA